MTANYYKFKNAHFIMKFPICRVCLKNDILCNGCSEKTKKSGIKEDEVNAFRKLNKLLKRFDPLKDVEIKRVIESKNTLLIISKKEDVSKLIGKSGGMVKKLGKDLLKQIRVVSESSTLEEFINEIFFFTPIIGINVLFTPEGDKYRIRIPSSERVVLPIPPDVFSQITGSILNIDAELVFE